MSELYHKKMMLFLKTKWYLIFLVIFLLSFACSPEVYGAEVVSPDSSSPQPSPQQTEKMEPRGTDEAEPQQSDKADKDIFTLDDAIELAAKIHPELKSAMALKNAAMAQVTQTESVYYPQISFSSSYSRSEYGNISTSSGSSTFSSIRASDSYRSSLSLQQKIYDFGRTAYSMIAARENLKAAEYDVLTTSDDVILSVRESYYNAVAAEKVLQVTQETIKQQELHLKQAIGFYQVGRRSKIEVTKAKVDLANAQLDLIKAENAVKLTKVKLANAIGIEKLPDKPLNEQVSFVELKMDLNRALSYARDHRPELLKISARERMYNARVMKAKAEWYPTLNGNASYGYSENHPLWEQNSWNWGISLDFDVFTGGRRNASIRESSENLKSIDANKERLWQNITLEVQQVILNMEEARKSISVLETALEQARENFTLAQGRYEVGVSDNIEFADARVALQQARIDLIKAILEYHIARAKLEKAIGLSVFKTSLRNRLLINGNEKQDNTKEKPGQ